VTKGVAPGQNGFRPRRTEMAQERLPMRKVREILRLRWCLKHGVRQTAAALGVSTGVVSHTTVRAAGCGLDWSAAEALSEAELEERLYGRTVPSGEARAEPDPAWMETELRRTGMTLELLHLEYLAEHPSGLRYTAFCDRYRRWKRRRKLTLRQPHKAGAAMQVDYSGKRPWLKSRETGEREAVELFVAVLPASGLIFAKATRTQQLHDWVSVHVDALEYFGGVPKALVPDQLRSAVTDPDAYEPGINRTYQELARHYGTAVVPARPASPKDKGKVERAVLTAQRWILARLRNETFFALSELNARIAELLAEVNAKPQRLLGGVNRRQLFERIERGALGVLPGSRFEPSSWRGVKVNRDYHVELERHAYSVPYALVDERVEARLTAQGVEIFLRGQRVAAHARSYEPHGTTTDPAHRPRHHAAWVEQDPGGLLAWAAGVGPSAEAYMRRLLDTESNFHADMRWRSGCGLRRVGNNYSAERTERACAIALRFGGRSYKAVANILKHGRDKAPDTSRTDAAPIEHGQVRGPKYYQ
jgi:transposase